VRRDRPPSRNGSTYRTGSNDGQPARPTEQDRTTESRPRPAANEPTGQNGSPTFVGSRLGAEAASQEFPIGPVSLDHRLDVVARLPITDVLDVHVEVIVG